MFCRSCDYLLTGAPDGRCPECGRAFDADDAATFLASSRRTRNRIFKTVAIASVAVWALSFVCAFAMITPRPPNVAWSETVGMSALAATISAVFLTLPIAFVVLLMAVLGPPRETTG